MGLVARDTRREFTPAPEGLHQGVCCDVVDLGLQETPWGQKEQVKILWALEVLDENDRAFLVGKKYTLSLNEKATLRHHLEAWRGRKFSPEELQGFDLEKLIGVNCQVQVVHNLSDDGRTYANVQAIVPLGKGMVKIHIPESYVRVQDRITTPTQGQEDSTHDAPAF